MAVEVAVEMVVGLFWVVDEGRVFQWPNEGGKCGV